MGRKGLLLTAVLAGLLLPELAAAATLPLGDAPVVLRETRRNDTLWTLTRDLPAAAGVTQQQVMMAVLRRNPAAFDRGSVFRLRRGVALTVPALAEIRAEDPALAAELYQRQEQAWRSSGQEVALYPLAGAVPAAAAAAPPTPVAATSPAPAPISILIPIPAPVITLPDTVPDYEPLRVSLPPAVHPHPQPVAPPAATPPALVTESPSVAEPPAQAVVAPEAAVPEAAVPEAAVTAQAAPARPAPESVAATAAPAAAPVPVTSSAPSLVSALPDFGGLSWPVVAAAVLLVLLGLFGLTRRRGSAVTQATVETVLPHMVDLPGEPANAERDDLADFDLKLELARAYREVGREACARRVLDGAFADDRTQPPPALQLLAG